LGGNTAKNATLQSISVSGKIVNVYNALIMASKVVSGTLQL
jgi:cell wall-associated protease